jgi:hypothetical protein
MDLSTQLAANNHPFAGHHLLYAPEDCRSGLEAQTLLGRFYWCGCRPRKHQSNSFRVNCYWTLILRSVLGHHCSLNVWNLPLYGLLPLAVERSYIAPCSTPHLQEEDSQWSIYHQPSHRVEFFRFDLLYSELLSTIARVFSHESRVVNFADYSYPNIQQHLSWLGNYSTWEI